jgi:hypothetical protein
MEKLMPKFHFKYMDSLVAYIIRNLDGRFVLHVSPLIDGKNHLWITEAGDTTILWSESVNLGFKGWPSFTRVDRFHALTLPAYLCETA